MQARLRKTKVVATLGPACDDSETLKEMIRAGLNVARFNLSHGTHAEQAQRLQRLRAVTEELSANVAVMVDTQGIEVRTGPLQNGVVELEVGDAFSLYTDARMGDTKGVSVSYSGLAEVAQPGDAIFLDDGALELSVHSLASGEVRCRVERGGTLRNRKGVNLPNRTLDVQRFEAVSREDLRFAVEHAADYVAASFVQTAEDVGRIRAQLREYGAETPVIAKIENRLGVTNLESIIAAADGSMVARGDLGVELPVEEVPAAQKKIIRATVTNGKPVITATQMLDSMERNPRPTRAEVSDVANAILDGTSAVMLSGETAVGKYPVEAVRTMSALALRAEASLAEYGHLQKILPHPSNVVTEAVSQAAITMAHHLRAAAVLSLTETGFTARSLSKYRPECTILAITSSESVAHRLALNWGVTAIRDRRARSDAERIDFGIRRALELGYVRPGDVVVATTGQSGQAGSTNLIRVITVAG